MDTDYDTIMQASRAQDPPPHIDQLPMRRPSAQAPASGFGVDLAAMAGPLMQMGLSRPPMSELLATARSIGMQMGSRAYYSFPAGGARVEGGSIKLAEELRQVWGYLTTAIEILDIRDGRVWLRGIAGDALTMSVHAEMRVYTLAAPSGGFAKNAEQADRWQTMQIGSGGSKALRTAIFRLLPDRLVQEAVQAAKDAKQPPAGRDFQEVCDALVATFGRSKAGVTLAELEQAAGVKRVQWRIADWRTLDDLYLALKAGETTVEEVWPGRVRASAETPPPSPLPKTTGAPPPLPESAQPQEREPGSDG